MLTYAQLTTPVTPNQAADTILGYLSALKFNTTSWESGSTQLTIVMTVAWLYSKITEMVAALTSGGYNATAEKEWLTRYSASRFQNYRYEAKQARHRIKFTCASNAGPYSPAVGRIVVTDGVSTFRLVDDDTYPVVAIPSGGSVYMVCECERAGAIGNSSVGTINRMVTTYVGVTCTNEEITESSSVTQQGIDEETDERLRVRNSTKWANLSIEVTIDSVVQTCLASSDYVQKVAVDDTNPRGAGSVDVYVFGEAGAIGSTTLAVVQTALDKRFIGNTREDDTKRALAINATAAVLQLTGTVYCYPGMTAVAKTNVEAALAALLKATPIGGQDMAPGPINAIVLNDIAQAIEGATGVKASVIDGVTLAGVAQTGQVISIPQFTGVVEPGTWALSYVATNR